MTGSYIKINVVRLDMMHVNGYPDSGISGNAINGDRCMDKVRCFMTEWDFMREFSTELTNTHQSLFWIEEPPSEWWMNAENKNVNYSVSLNCRAQSYNYDSEVFYEYDDFFPIISYSFV